MLLDKPLKELYISEMILSYDGKKYTLVKKKKFKINKSRYYTDGRFYWIWTRNKPFASIRFEKIFTNKKIDDNFLVSVDTIFSFEDGIEHKERLEYKVLLINNWIYFPDK